MIALHRRPSPRRSEDLSTAELDLLKVCRKIGFGRLQMVDIIGGEPVFSIHSIESYDYRFGSNSEFSKPADASHALDSKQIELIERIREFDDAIIEKIEIRGGLPISMRIEVMND